MDKFVQVSGPDSAAKPNPKWSNGMKALIPSFEALRGQSAGISDGMRQHCGEVGVVAEIGSSGRCRVSFSDGSQFWYDPDRLLVPEESEKGTAPMAKASVSRKTLKDFPSEKEYEAYLKAVLKTGTKLVAVSGDRKGDRGTYLGTNSFQPPCHVQWEKLGKAYWVHWRDVELDDGTPVQEDAPKPVTKLESGQWYRWTGGPERPGNWNNEGMDFVLDGKPHQVKESSGKNASFFDSPKPDSKWYFGHVMDKFVQVSGPDSAAKPNPKWSNGMKALIPSFEALRGQSAGISDGMRQHCGEVGVVAEIGSSGRCRVSFSDGSQFWYDPDRLLVPEESEKGTAPMAKASVSRKTLKDFP
eukprot:RCo033428